MVNFRQYTWVILAFATTVRAEFSPEQIEFFEKEVRPVLAEHCYDCHSGSTAKNGLNLDSRNGVLKGTDYHKVIDLEKPGDSRLIRAIKHIPTDKTKPMPDKGEKLPDEAIAALEKWVQLGLPWPEGEDQPVRKDPKDHWSFQPTKKIEVPAEAGHPIDYFIDRKLAENKLKPAEPANRATLYRRAYTDLLGLPPKFDELQAYLNDPKADAETWPALIDHLLGSPHYGERMARHWMDIARYSDTKGYLAGGRERRFVYSYTYRDWLIRSMNEDLPWDQFLLYQLAADKLVDREDTAERKHLAALGFITLSKVGRREEVIDDRVDTTFRGTMGLTVSCARCHDHKFDPISTKEYYSLYGIFNHSHEPKEAVTIGDPPSGPEYENYLVELAKRQKVVDDYEKGELEKIRDQFPTIKDDLKLRDKLPRDVRKTRGNMQTKVDNFIADSGMEPPRALIVEDRSSKPGGQQVFIRGNPGRRGDPAPARFLNIITGEDAPDFTQGSGRIEMAQAIVDPSNPLTARVAVNRIWAQHFGEGLVRTVSDFGIQGDTPSHPELLDWLANWFIDNGWSVKKLHRLIMTSAAYQREVTHPAATGYAEIDPENRLLWRFNRQRLDFETMRDSMLDVARNLDNTLYGRSIDITTTPFTNRRTVYAFVDRQNLDPVFRTFDFANPQETTGKRPSTSIPMQALYALNGEFAIEQARNLINHHPEVKSANEPAAKVDALHRAIFARKAKPSDVELATHFIKADEEKIAATLNQQTLGQWQYGYGQFNRETGQTQLTLLPHWTGKEWQIAEERPVKNDSRSYLMASPTTGHPGSNSEFCLIIRWIAPRNLDVQINSVMERRAVGKGTGLIAQVAVSGQGIVKEFDYLPEFDKRRIDVPSITVKEGDTIDFIVDPRGNASHDTFSWPILIKNKADLTENWNYTEEFSGPADPLSPWEAYTQALLMTNEFLFVD